MPFDPRAAAALLLIISTTHLGTTGNAQAAPPNTGTRPVNCALKPSQCGYPDATNTGVPAGTKLKVVNGDLTVTKAGAVIEGKDIRGCVLVKAPNVTIRRSKVTCTGHYAIGSFIETYKGGGLLLEDVEVDCRNHNTTGVGSYGTTARRLNVHGCENGFDIDDTTSVLDSYIHDLYEGATGHADGIQLAGGSNIRIMRNTIYAPGGTSAIISHPTNNANVLVENNLLAGGAYTLYCPRDRSRAYRVIGNRFGRNFSGKSGAYGAWTDCRKAAVVRDNFWDNTLRPL
ncbi:hypothetical protein [Nonomuraea sp. NPDC049400]|uniref:hypothetical protein n=1 Tax=Nonomuraea sp. NPDC049400 TaxID=3364352 RepID=UPI0037A4BC1E